MKTPYIHPDKRKLHVGTEIVAKKLCCGNGICATICPTNAISISTESKRPIIDEEKCIWCGLCVDYCPGIKVDFPQKTETIFGKNDVEDAGFFRSSCVGHGTDPVIRYAGASGGVITSLLVYALEKKLIDGAFVAMDNKEKPWISEPYLARTKEELLQAQQSRYMIIPMASALAQLKTLEGKYAFVGVPCTIHGIRNMPNSHITEKIAFLIGIYCGHNYTCDGVEFMVRKIGTKSLTNVKNVRFREGTWPGWFQVTENDETKRRITKHAYNFVTPLFLDNRCMTCIDLANDFADISVGDAWLSEYEGKKEGYAMVLGRTEKGQQLLDAAVRDGYLVLQSITKGDVYRGHRHTLEYKKKGGFARIKILRAFGYSVPDYGYEKKTSKIDLFRAALFLLLIRIVQTNIVRTLVYYLPTSALGRFMIFVRKIMTWKNDKVKYRY